MSKAKIAKALAAAAIVDVAAAGVAASPASAAAHPPTPTTATRAHPALIFRPTTHQLPRQHARAVTRARQVAARPRGFVPRVAKETTRPDTTGNCVHEGPSNRVQTCAIIIGHQPGQAANYVSTMSMSACVAGTPGMWLHYEISGPDLSHPYNSPKSWYRSNGNCAPIFGLGFYKDVTPNPFYFKTWEKLPNGHYTQVGYIKLTVS